MNRRQSLKAFGTLSLGVGALLQSCKTEDKKLPDEKNEIVEEDGSTEMFEQERLSSIQNSSAFFNNHEKLTLILLADIIIPRDAVSGSASDANVIDFIEFIVKDIPEHQLPLRGGLKWLDMQCLNRYDQPFRMCTADEQIEMLNDIAFPSKATPGMGPGVMFFDRVRNLTASGFYTSEIGIKDIGYMGNVPNKWEGVPADVLAQYGLNEH